MAFVNEYMSEKDIEKYHINEINRFYATSSSVWTVNREKAMYLRIVDRGGPEHFDKSAYWHFLWHGNILLLKIMPLESEKLTDTSRWMYKEVQELRLFKVAPRGHQKEFVLPDELKEKRDEIFKDLYEGLLVP